MVTLVISAGIGGKSPANNPVTDKRTASEIAAAGTVKVAPSTFIVLDLSEVNKEERVVLPGTNIWGVFDEGWVIFPLNVGSEVSSFKADKSVFRSGRDFDSDLYTISAWLHECKKTTLIQIRVVLNQRR